MSLLIHHAVYGERNCAHDLLACTPVGGYFAIWRTLEDPGASRRGMVQSHVALIPLDDVVQLNDLGAVLDTLPRQVILAPEASPFEVIHIDDGSMAQDAVPP